MKAQFEVLANIPGHPKLKVGDTVPEGFADLNLSKHPGLFKEIQFNEVIITRFNEHAQQTTEIARFKRGII